MLDPYSILGLSPGVDESALRKRYLELVQKYPPEREPEKAAQIRAAYESLRDPVERLKHDLFDFRSSETLETLIQEYSQPSFERRLPTTVLLSLGQS